MRKKELSIKNHDLEWDEAVVIEHPTFTVTITDGDIVVERGGWEIRQFHSSFTAKAPDVSIEGMTGTRGTVWSWRPHGKIDICDISDARRSRFTTVPKPRPKPSVRIGQSPRNSNESVWWARKEEGGVRLGKAFDLDRWEDAVHWALEP